MPRRPKRPAASSKTSRGRLGARLRAGAAATVGLLGSSAARRAAGLAVGFGLLAAGGFAAVRYGVPFLLDRAEARHPLDATRLRVVFERAPAWVPQAALDALGDEVRAALDGATSFDPEALRRAHAALATSGWFERVEQVVRRNGDAVVVTGEFRVPFALVRSEGLDHVVDRHYRRLPLAYASGGERPPLPLVVNVRFPKPAEPGSAWAGEDVRAAIHLARIIRDRPWFAAGQIAAIDAGRFHRERILELVGLSRDGSVPRIVWGCDPEERSLSEMPPNRKLECLDALWQARRSLADESGRSLDLRFDAVTLAATPSR
jgi:hypothetical protein